MDLTTRCPECGEVFSASLQQLQLRKGFIRCINCANIFDGYEAVVPPGEKSASKTATPAPSQVTRKPPKRYAPVTPAPAHPAQPPARSGSSGSLTPPPRPSPAASTSGSSAPFTIPDSALPSAGSEPEFGVPKLESDEDDHHISMEGSSHWRPEPSLGQPHEGALSGSSRAEPVFEAGQDRVHEFGGVDHGPASSQSAYRPSVVKQRDQTASRQTPAVRPQHGEESWGPAADERGYVGRSGNAADQQRAHPTSNRGSADQRPGEAVPSWASSDQQRNPSSREHSKVAPPPQLPPHLPRPETGRRYDEADSGQGYELPASGPTKARPDAPLGSAKPSHFKIDDNSEGLSRREQPQFESTHYLRAGRGHEPTISDPISGGTRAPQVPPIYVEPRRQADDVDRPAPDFLEDAGDRGWSGPVWLVLVVVGLMVLAAQLAYIYRNQVAQAAPWTRPILQQACQPLGCTVDYARRIDHVSIMSSSLQAQPGQDPSSADRQLTLNVVLRNTFGYAQEWPNLTLDLVDVSGSRVARRILAPQDYLPTPSVQAPFPPQSEMHLAIPVTVMGHQVNGYQLGKYYP